MARREASKSLKRVGLEKTHTADFERELEACLTQNQPDEAIQNLSLGVLRKLLGRGLDILSVAAKVYRSAPSLFKARYAVSKPAFAKDWSLHQKMPINSFPAFKTAENPSISRDEKLVQIYAYIYRRFNPKQWAKNDRYLTWLWHTDAGRKCYQETKWLQDIAGALFQKRLGQPLENLSPAVLLRMPTRGNK